MNDKITKSGTVKIKIWNLLLLMNFINESHCEKKYEVTLKILFCYKVEYMWSLLKKKISEIRMMWIFENLNLKNISTIINSLLLNMGTISETIFTVHFYIINFHKHVVTLKTMSLLNKIRRLDYEAVQSESKAIIWSQSSHFVTF